MMSTADFADERTFVRSFIEYIEELVSSEKELMKTIYAKPLQALSCLKSQEERTLKSMFGHLGKMCEISQKPIVLMIDEVDSASNNQVFIEFLALLRGYYLEREKRPIFHSVVLAGVYRLKNMHFSTSKFVQGHKFADDLRCEHQYNSPWNIAAKFKIDMSFSVVQIASMLQEYEEDNCTGMDIGTISQEIYNYTSGYPYLVSAICKMLDEEIPENPGFESPAAVWSKQGIAEVVKALLKENVPLFDSMIKQMDLYKDLREMIKEIIYQGKRIPFSLQAKPINLGVMFGFLREGNGSVVIANRIFEMVLLNMFIAEEAIGNTAFQYGERDRNQLSFNFNQKKEPGIKTIAVEDKVIVEAVV